MAKFGSPNFWPILVLAHQRAWPNVLGLIATIVCDLLHERKCPFSLLSTIARIWSSISDLSLNPILWELIYQFCGWRIIIGFSWWLREYKGTFSFHGWAMPDQPLSWRPISKIEWAENNSLIATFPDEKGQIASSTLFPSLCSSYVVLWFFWRVNSNYPAIIPKRKERRNCKGNKR